MTSVTVVVPTRDTRELTLRCLASLPRLGLPALEVVVVDDGSRDGTTEAIGTQGGVDQLVRHERPLGFTAAANDGLAVAHGELLLLLNSDTEIRDHGGGATLRDAFSRDPSLGVAGARLLYADGRRQWSGGDEPTPGWMFAQASGGAAALARLPGYRRLRPEGRTGSGTAGVAWVSGAAMCLRRGVWQQVGPFDPRFELYCQDTDLCLRAGDAGWKVVLLEDFRVVHLLGGTITGDAGAARRFHPARMWADLVRLAAKRGGIPAARRARRALILGARLRLVTRRLVRPPADASARAAWRHDTAAYTAGLEALVTMPLPVDPAPASAP